MKNKIFSFIIILSCLLVFGCSIVFASSPTSFTYDDRAPEISYSARTATITSVGYDGTASRLSRAATAYFTFYGSDLEIHSVTFTSSGRARVYIDGEAIGYTSTGVSASYTPVLSFQVHNLSDGKHTCSIEAWDSTVTNPSGTSVTAYFFLDYIVVSKDLDLIPLYWNYLYILITVALGIQLVTFCIKFALWRLMPDD